MVADAGQAELFNSCKNRHCPKCQTAYRKEWAARLQAQLLPIEYYHVIFTVPRPVTLFAMVNPKVLYPLILRAGAEAVLKLGRTWEGLRAWMALIALLHTWGQIINNHLHSHTMIPAGGLSFDGKRWVGLPEKDYRDGNQWKTKCMPGVEFIGRFLQHVFPQLCTTSGGSASWRRAWRPRSLSRFVRYWECQRSEAELCQRPQATTGWVTATCKATRMPTCRTPTNRSPAAAAAVELARSC